MQLKITVYVIVGLLLLSDVLPCVKATLNAWSIRNKRAAAPNTSTKQLKKCLSPCMIFHTWCKNDGKCREKGEDCTWYCECPDNCEGFFCEKLVPDAADPLTAPVEVKVVVQKVEKKEASSFDKSKLAKALAGIIMKKQTREEDKGPVAPDTIYRIGNKTRIDVKKNVTASVLLNCPPDLPVDGKVIDKSNCNCTTETGSTLSPTEIVSQNTQTAPTLDTGKTPANDVKQTPPVSTKAISPDNASGEVINKPASTTENNIKTTESNSTETVKITDETIGSSPDASGLLKLIEKAMETVPLNPEIATSVEKPTTVQPTTSQPSALKSTTVLSEISTNKPENKEKVNTTESQIGLDSKTKDISISGHKDQLVEGNELYSARSTIKVTTVASTDHASILASSQMSVDQVINKNDSDQSTPISAANRGQSLMDRQAVDTEPTTSVPPLSTVTNEAVKDKASSKISIKTIGETSEPVVPIISIGKPTGGPVTQAIEITTTQHKISEATPLDNTVTKGSSIHIIVSAEESQNNIKTLPPYEGSGFPPEHIDFPTEKSTTMKVSTTTDGVTTSDTATTETILKPSPTKSEKSTTTTIKPTTTEQHNTTTAQDLSTTLIPTTKLTTDTTPPNPSSTTTVKSKMPTKAPESTTSKVHAASSLAPNDIKSTKPKLSTSTTTTPESTTAYVTNNITTTSAAATTGETSTSAAKQGSTPSSSGQTSTAVTATTTETASSTKKSKPVISEQTTSTDQPSSTVTTEVLHTTQSVSTTTARVASTAAQKSEVIEKIVPIVQGKDSHNANGDNKPGGDVDDMTLVSNKLPDIQRDINISELKPELLEGNMLQNQDFNNIL